MSYLRQAMGQQTLSDVAGAQVCQQIVFGVDFEQAQQGLVIDFLVQTPHLPPQDFPSPLDICAALLSSEPLPHTL